MQHVRYWSSQYKTKPERIKIQPGILYNYIGLDGCQGYIQRAMEFMSRTALPFNFPYDPTDCSRQANSSLIQKHRTTKYMALPV